MEPGTAESNKRPRLSKPSTGSFTSGTPHGSVVSLPPPPPNLNHATPPPLQSGAQHPAPPGQYQPHYPPRSTEPHPHSHPPHSHLHQHSHPTHPHSHPHPHPHPHSSHSHSLPPAQLSPLHPPRPGQHPDDRRHHEQEPYTPIQDSRQQPHSPAHMSAPQGPPPHPFHNPYPMREPSLVKRDPEDHAPAPRPHSANNHLEGPPGNSHPPMHPGPHQPPPPPLVTAPPGHPGAPGPPPPAYGEEPRRHTSYDAGPPPPPTPGAYGRHPSYPPPGPPHPQTPSHYEPLYPNEPFYSVQYSTAAKRKVTRASQACDSCRALKAKCDETKPCKNCREKNVECKYREPAPKATDKTTIEMLESMGALQKSMDAQERRFARIERFLASLYPQLELKNESEASNEDIKPVALPVPVPAPAPAPAPAQPSHEQFPMEMPPADEYMEPCHAPYDMPEEELEADPGPPVAPGEPAIPANHTTGAGHLLRWPCIDEMVSGTLAREKLRFPPEYPIRLEEERGVLRVYGRGEGRSTVPRDKDARTEHGATEVLEEASYSDMSSPTPGDSAGYIGGFSPVNISDYGSTTSRPPVLTPGGMPDFSESKVKMYVKSFEENILIMHPIILPKELQKLVGHFLASIPKPSSMPFTPAPTAAFVQSSPQQAAAELTGSKRKRSPGLEGPDTPQMHHRVGRPARTIHNAVVLTILALGKICLHRDHIPDVAHDNEAPRPAHNFRNGYPSSPGGHPSSPEAYPAMVSPKDADRPALNRRPSFQNTRGSQPRRNYDTIPGLEYFALATDIIGNQLGGNTMNHVYANIFAGLFHGQLGRVIESHAYIAHACTTLMNIMRPSLTRLSILNRSAAGPKRTRDNQLLFAFWTCLQLESDIVAEIPRHQSGILAQEDNLPYPNTSEWQAEDPGSHFLQDRVLESYAGQLYLRKHLNLIHRLIYGSEDANVNLADVEAAQARVANMQWVPASFHFKPDDPPATDILSARLRAKYWGSQAITYRPCIKQILELSYDTRRAHNIPTNSSELSYDELPEQVTRIMGALPQEVWEHAKKGIRALIESTQAFHGLGDKRPIITNVFGTAHAQWGNLIVLSACYRDPFLRRYITEAKLQDLYTKTIHFFRKVAPPTSALAFDKRVLEGLYRELFNHSAPMQASASFSSIGSGPSPSMAQANLAAGSHGPTGAKPPQADQMNMMMPPAHHSPQNMGPGSGPQMSEGMLAPMPGQAGMMGSMPPGQSMLPEQGAQQMEPMMAPPRHHSTML